ncbi:MAG: hypothetical protein ING65_17125 [Rhodocyclaceae bacterium]|nr:hypothetical protein [Rhodocyclaceae bacterium]
MKRKLYLYNWNSRSDAAEPSKLVANVARDLVQTLARNLDPNRFLEGGHAGSGLYLSADPLASMAFGQNLVLFKIKEGTQFRPASKNPSADYFAGFCPLHEYRWSSAGKAVVQENSEIAFVLHDASIIDPADTLILMNARGRDFHLSSLAERSEQGLLNGIVFLDFWESVSEKTTINDIKLEIFMRAIRRILMDPNLFADGSARTAALAIRARALAIQPNLLEGKRGPNFERALDRRRLGFERPVVREGFPGGADELETIFAAFGVPFEDLDNTIGYTARGIPIPNVLRTVDSVLSQFATPNERELLGRAQKDPATLGVEMRQWKQDWIRFLREFSW